LAVDKNGKISIFSSSQRYKKNIIEPKQNISQDIDLLNPKLFNFISSEEKQVLGLIAEEVHAIDSLSELLVFYKDENKQIPQSIDYNSVMILTLYII
jgi:hypothetical protein